MNALKLVIVVDRLRCTGIGICESIAPRHFEVGDDGVLILLDVSLSESEMKDVKTAVGACPAKALKLQGAVKMPAGAR